MTLQEQIANMCIHFTGLMDKRCEKGVKYEDVRVANPGEMYRLPCLNHVDTCNLREFPSPESIEKEIEEINGLTDRVFTAYAKIKSYFKETGINPGRIPCECGGELRYTIASSNGHIWAKCNNCELAFNE